MDKDLQNSFIELMNKKRQKSKLTLINAYRPVPNGTSLCEYYLAIGLIKNQDQIT